MQLHDTYSVTVRDQAGTTLAEETFPVGQWKEIGFWLDSQGFIDPDFVVEVRVVEIAETV
jgi:hypothetical protein